MESYDKIGTGYNNTRKADFRIVNQLVNLIHVKPNGKIADIGAGTGNYSYELAKLDYSVIAIEPSEIMIQQSKSHPHLEWKKGFAENIPLENGSVDTVICTLAAHHFQSMETFISESRRILKPGGNLVLFTFDPRLLAENDWLKEYFPELNKDAADSVPPRNVMIEMLESEFHNTPIVTAFPLPSDLTDLFFRSGWKYPERYLDPDFRNGISVFRLSDAVIVDNTIKRLQNDLEQGVWDDKYGYVRNLDSFNADYYFIAVSKTGNSQ